ncbi:VanZ like family protein [Poriferisphaera corsica]|uniref:VanZ like family protein n=1 Tax=Poriferisphaera corsica TaxID=2528020 RepID=A0A517YRW8_9BACT|nr:VanZ family protein [Poriferisphaera corsica]QDU32972.1 VanZ like family protein [Poriferisphaera corsica]
MKEVVPTELFGGGKDTADTTALWMRPWVVALVYGVLLIYGSLLPFDLGELNIDRVLIAMGSMPVWRSGSGSFSRLGVAGWLSDWGINVLMYIPFGVLVRLAMRRVFGQWWLQISVAMFVTIGLSYCVESLQTLSGWRVGSLNDWLSNSLGGIVGAMCGARLNQLRSVLAFKLYIWWARLRLDVEVRRTYLLRLVIAGTVLVLSLLMLHAKLVDYLMDHAGDGRLSEMPFYAYYLQPYDVSAVLIGSSFVVYAVVGLLLLILIQSKRVDSHATLTLAVVAGIAYAMQLLMNVSGRFAFDTTEPIIAVGAVMVVYGVVHYAQRSIKASCRRHEQVAVKHDRRRKPFEYG